MWSFSFLNLEQSFSQDSLDWSFGEYGMLWTYNLNTLISCISQLYQGELETLSKFYAAPVKKNPIILHPYPTAENN